MKTYIVEGGIGKQIAFTAVIDALSKRDNDKIQVYTPHLAPFISNPSVHLVLDQQTLPLNDPRILGTDIIYCEPYKSNWVRGEEHLIESYCKLLGIEYAEEMRPNLFTEFAKQEAKKLAADIERDFVIVQFFGGQPPGSNGGYQSTNPGRNYPHYLAQIVVNELSKDFDVLNFGHQNEPEFLNSRRLECSIPVLHELLKLSRTFVSIDSCLQHCAVSANKSGVVIWGNTKANQSGYIIHNNLCEDYDVADPRRVMVDPEKIMEAIHQPY